MSTIEIVAGSLLLLTCLLIIVVISLQGGKTGGMSGVIMGGEGTSVRGKTKDTDAQLANNTQVLAVIFFVATVVVS
ncbi:MAG: preprotein translocase subunit SecG, partial [Oscillospiraceae bacterium]